jgi:hypothetical protein
MVQQQPSKAAPAAQKPAAPAEKGAAPSTAPAAAQVAVPPPPPAPVALPTSPEAPYGVRRLRVRARLADGREFLSASTYIVPEDPAALKDK